MKISTELIRQIPRKVVIIFIIYFLQGVVHNLGHPVTPDLVNEMGLDDYFFGLFFAAMSLGLLVGGPIWGTLGDRGKKRIYIVAGLLVYSVGQYAFAYVGNVYWMIFFRFLSGFGVSASITLIITSLIEESPEEFRTVYLGWYQALFVVGAGLGYMIGGFLVEFDFYTDMFGADNFQSIFLIQAIFNVVHAVYIYFLIGKDKEVENKEERQTVLQAFTDIRKLNGNMILFLLSLAFISLGAINISKFIEVYIIELGYSAGQMGLFVGITSYVSLAATIFIVPLVSAINKDFTMMVIIQILSAIIIFIVFRMPVIIISLYTLFMLYVILKAVYTPLEQHFISSNAPKGKLGNMMGVRQLFFSVGLVVGPLIGGVLYNIEPLYVFDFSAIMFVLGVILLLAVGRRIKNGNKTNENLDN